MYLKKFVIKIQQIVGLKLSDFVLILVFSIAIIKLSSLYFSVKADDGNWEQFKVEHNCILRTTETGTQRLSWSCDDNKIYYRWRQQR